MSDDQRSIASYEKVNYSLRPGKAIERRMLCDIFQRMYPFLPVYQYGYIGFGSIYFSDFHLFHRILGINKLISIEREEGNQERFELNKPFKCIELVFGKSHEKLPSIDLSSPHLIWLDYDGCLDINVLSDIATVAAKSSPGTSLVVSYNVHPDPAPSEEFKASHALKTGTPFSLSEYRLNRFNDRLVAKVPSDVTGKDLSRDKLPETCRRIVINEIESQLSIRNSILTASNKIRWKQVANFSYKDGAPMATLVFVLFSEQQSAAYEACRFNELPFVSESEEPFSIQVPCLTPREMRHFNSVLPTNDYTEINRHGVPEEDVIRYAGLYRYFPAYTEVLFA